MRSRNEQEKAQRREDLLDAAYDVFSERGFEQTSMDHIAKKAGFSRGLLYVYFDDKQGIYDALRLRSTKILYERMKRYTEQYELGIERARACGMAFYHFFQEDRRAFDCLSHVTSLAGHASASIDKRSPEAMEVERNIMQIMTNALALGLDDGTINPKHCTNLLETALFFRGSLFGLLVLQSSTGSIMLDLIGHDRDTFIINSIERLIDPLKANRPSNDLKH